MGVLSLFHRYEACSRSQKHKFQTELDIENFRSILFWSENVNSGVKSKSLSLYCSWSNQNDFYENRKILKFKIENQKSIWSKHVFWCVIQFCQTDFENIKNWMSSSIKCHCYFGPKGDQTFYMSIVIKRVPFLPTPFGSLHMYSE